MGEEGGRRKQGGAFWGERSGALAFPPQKLSLFLSVFGYQSWDYSGIGILGEVERKGGSVLFAFRVCDTRQG